MEYQNVCDNEDDARREMSRRARIYQRAEATTQACEKRLENAQQAQRFAKESLRRVSLRHASVAQDKGEIEDELFANDEEIEEYWRNHQ
ncbi:hypothetical protein [Thalassococcus lentus]|uniref:Uncharacterized protein n=1 Tax=Thalassococcus lentus TaxID=1210524 RepID=A0ABT4XS50_9RHOB|nr:hypothetical protein [Thalassococcus lentus]MDA7424771.1 hypothetical protein [Thalassococcus lentus]